MVNLVSFLSLSEVATVQKESLHWYIHPRHMIVTFVLGMEYDERIDHCKDLPHADYQTYRSLAVTTVLVFGIASDVLWKRGVDGLLTGDEGASGDGV